MKKTYLLIALLATFLINLSTAGNAQNKKTYTVAVFIQPPFTYYKNNYFSGLSVDIWRIISQTMKIKYKFVKAPADPDQAIEAVKKHHYDALIGPLSVTSHRTKLVSFSRPYFINQTGLLKRQWGSQFWYLIGRSMSGIFSYFAIMMLVFIIGYAYLFIRYEEYNNYPKQNSRSSRWIHVFYITILSLFTANPQDFIKHKIVRFFHMISLLGTLLVVSSVVGVIASSLTISNSILLPSHMSKQNSLMRKNIAVVKNSFSNYVVTALGGNAFPYANFDAAVRSVIEKKNDGVLNNLVALNYYRMKHPNDNIHVVKIPLGNNQFAFAYPQVKSKSCCKL